MVHILGQDDKPPLEELVLQHYGVKGMRWGVRKDRSARKTTKKKNPSQQGVYQPTEHELAVLKAAGPGMRPDLAMAKYGPGSLEESGPAASRKGLTPQQKQMLKVGVGIGVGVAAIYGLNKLADHHNLSSMGLADAPKSVKDFMLDYTKSGGKAIDLNALSTNPVSLSSGSVLKRVSTKAERAIRSDGFYAAYRDEDVTRYKAVLPVFWKQWGKTDTVADASGYVVNIKAKRDVKAPSPKETYNLYKQWLSTQNEGSAYRDFDNYDSAGAFTAFVQGWADTRSGGTQSFFSLVKNAGYNAVVDLNDSGGLSEAPLRILTNDGFAIDSHERLTSAGIRSAQEAILRLKHFIDSIVGDLRGSTMDLETRKPSPEDIVLQHYGVKGMRWGVRKDRQQSIESMTSAQKQARIKQLRGELARMNPELGIHGAGVRGHYGKKMTKKEFKKNPNYDWRKLPAEERLAINKKLTQKAVRGTLLKGGAAAAAGVVASTQAKRLNPANKNDAAIIQAGVKYAGIAFAANAAVGTFQTVRGIRQEGRDYEIRVELTKLGDKKRGR